ncbi:site-2 protease family protein [Candidatus Saccharibacteria bacterium]|nr:site-2 protease family protein [Candidatus Saccharibacteria bacterium]
MQILLLVLGLLLFVGLVVAHELGHFIIARRNGVEAEEFGIGFPPKLWKKRIKSARGDYDLTFNLLPLGGFVKLKGEHDADTHKGSFGAASLRAKTKIMLAGVAVNFVLGVFILTLVAVIGMPKVITTASVGEEQFTVKSDTKVIKNEVLAAYVEEGSPAASAGVKGGDTIVSISSADGSNSVNITQSSELKEVTKSFANQTVKIEFQRGEKKQSGTADVRSSQEVEASIGTDNPKGYLGVVPSDYTVQRSTWSAPVVALGLSGQLTKLTLKGLWTATKGLGSLIAGLVTNNQVARSNGQVAATEQVSGPVGIFNVLKQGASRGINFVLFIVGLISITLAIMNVLPIPALDGGRFYLVLFSRGVLKRPLSQKAEERIVGGAFMALMVLFILITIVDVKRL